MPIPMVQEKSPILGLVVGNYCHDVLFRDDLLIGESLGGASSFISNVLDSLSPSSSSTSSSFSYISKVGPDFSYSVPHHPIITTSSPTTLFHAHFSSPSSPSLLSDRILKRVFACDPILPHDLPTAQYEFGLAGAVAGEIPPETLHRMLDLCHVVLVDIQALIRTFDPRDGTVSYVPLHTTPFFHLLPRIAFLKASAEEAPFLDLQHARHCCCVIVTRGKDGCTVYYKDWEVQVPPFPAMAQVDPTGAGDSFFGGFLVGLLSGLTVPDAALLGNLLGSLTVGQIGVPNFDRKIIQNVKKVLERSAIQCVGSCWRNVEVDIQKLDLHEEFRISLIEAAKLTWISRSTELVDDHDSKHQ